jgi:ribosomal protein S18 acetylase RimI-like enzyme
MSEYQISPITPDIESQLPAVAKRAFGKGVSLILPKKNLWGFYAHQDGKIGGAVYLKKWTEEEGCLEWIYVDPSAQGHKLGRRLFRAGMDALYEANLPILFTLVRGSNTASWSMFAKEGFVKPSVFHTLTQYSRKSLFHRIGFHLADGYNIWVKDPSLNQPIHPTRYGLLKTFVFAGVTGLALGLFGLQGFETLLITVSTLVVVTGMRILLEYVVARSYGPLRWNAPQGGTLLSFLIALTGTWWPTFGHFSPQAEIYRDSDYAKINAYSRVATLMFHVFIYVLAAILVPDLFANGYGFILGFVLAIQLLPFFPVDDSDGSRIYAYSKPLYLITLLSSLVAFLSTLVLL